MKIYRTTKRILDVIISLTLLVALAPAMLCVMAAIRLDSKGPAIFKQQRVGKNGKTFTCYKLRTMKTGTPERARCDFPDSECYVTKIGAILRKYGIDELPQLYNVLIGDMSLVGPRPLIPSEALCHRMRTDLGIYTLRPGITGLAQIKKRNGESAYERVCLDFDYFCRKSLGLDALILISTLFPSASDSLLLE